MRQRSNIWPRRKKKIPFDFFPLPLPPSTYRYTVLHEASAFCSVDCGCGGSRGGGGCCCCCCCCSFSNAAAVTVRTPGSVCLAQAPPEREREKEKRREEKDSSSSSSRRRRRENRGLDWTAGPQQFHLAAREIRFRGQFGLSVVVREPCRIRPIGSLHLCCCAELHFLAWRNAGIRKTWPPGRLAAWLPGCLPEAPAENPWLSTQHVLAPMYY